MKKIDTFIASDVHLGSDLSRADALIETLKNYNFKRLILLGDIFDDLNFTRLKSKHWELLSYIRKLSNEKKDIEIVWIIGNHDELFIDVMKHLLGVPVFTEYIWEYGGKKYLAIHGHQFDSFLLKNETLSNIANFLYKFLLKIENKKHRLSRAIDRRVTQWRRVSKKITKDALVYGKTKDVDYIFCGHTHRALSYEDKDNNIIYFNTGCWTDIPSTYIIIDESGVRSKNVWL